MSSSRNLTDLCRSCGPVVCCVVTDEVERISRKNNLSFCELLSAFSGAATDAGTVPFRSVSGHVTLDDLHVSFVRSSVQAPLPLVPSDRILRWETGESKCLGAVALHGLTAVL